MATQGEWRSMFAAAFTQSRNPMVLLDDQRRQREVNGAYLQLLGYPREELIGKPVYEVVAGGPMATPAEWERMLNSDRFTGTAKLRRADGTLVGVQWAATVESITGRRQVLVVALSTSRAGAHFRRQPGRHEHLRSLSHREQEIIHMVAMGNTGPEIAEELHISHNTVRTHVRSAMEKSGARSRAHLVAKALGEGLALENGHAGNGS